jgi:hypothetical protein
MGMELIGKGRYTRAYRVQETGKVMLHTYEPNNIVKDVLVAASLHDNPHLPRIVPAGPLSDYRGKKRHAYEMNYYPTICSRDSVAWQILKTCNEVRTRVLHRLWEYWTGATGSPEGFIREFATQCNLSIVNELQVPYNGFKVPSEVREALYVLASAAYRLDDSILFEFRQCNTGVDAQGRIVFRDPLFNATGTWLDTNSGEAAAYFKDAVAKLNKK